ncbi:MULTISPECIES: TetR/AcrR family transcriptional regulator [unclassified Gordonia (in: high G+C Gram-positive bacteria)]
MNTRNRIVQVAGRLFFENGYERTSFAAIAGEVGISRGNFYYHFRTKDMILDAVLQARLVQAKAQLADWSAAPITPLERIMRFVETSLRDPGDVEDYGCPMSPLCVELAAMNHPARVGAVAVIEAYREWLRIQLECLGYTVDESDDVAVRLLAWLHGTAAAWTVLRYRDSVQHETAHITQWLTSGLPHEVGRR